MQGPERLVSIVGVGSGGHAKVLVDVLQRMECFAIVGLVDIATARHGQKVLGVPVLGDDAMLPELRQRGVSGAFIGIGGIGGSGDNELRARAFDQTLRLGFVMIRAVHPQAIVAESVDVGTGIAIMAGAVVNPGTVLGKDVIVNTGAIIDHDCRIGDHAHVAPGAVLSGGITVGPLAHIGTGARIRQGIVIGEGATVGAGAVVVKDVPPGVVVVGTPARLLERHHVE